MSNRYYEPSRRMPATVIMLWFLTSLIMLPVAWLYAWLLRFGSLGLLVGVYFLIFGACCGLAAHVTAKWGKARDPGQMAKIGALIGLLAWYFQLAVWLSFLSEHPAVALVANGAPAGIVDFATAPVKMAALLANLRDAKLIDGSGQLLIGRSPLAGWIMELIFLVSVPTIIGYARCLKPFCETGGEWGKIHKLPNRYACINDPEEFTRQLESDPRALLARLTAVPPSSEGFTRVELTCCDASKKAFLSIRNTEITLKDGTSKSKESLVVCNLSIDTALAHDLIGGRSGESLDPPTPLEPDPPELRAAIDHLANHDYAAVLLLAAPYLSSADERLCKDAIRLSALASSRTNQWSSALDFWRSLFDREATAHNALQVATASVMAGHVAQGRQWIETAGRMNATSRDVPGILILTNFITALKNSGHPTEALPYLDEVKEIYEDLHITDPTFLVLRGLPLFESFIENSRPVVTTAFPVKEAAQWYETMIPHLDAAGATELRRWLRAGMPALPSPDETIKVAHLSEKH
jgi:hypothetical protein